MVGEYILGRSNWPVPTFIGVTDGVQELLQREIDKFRIQSLDNFGLEVSVEPASSAVKIFNYQERFLGFDQYELGLYSQPKVKSIRVTDDGRVEIKQKRRWLTVPAYLQLLIDRYASGNHTQYQIQMAGREQQQRWWMANGKVFRLMDLPSEIRELIYGYALGPRVEPYPTSKARGLGKSTLALVARMPNANLLLTSRLVYQEASNILFKYIPFCVDHLGVLSRLLKNDTQSSRIRQLHLSLRHAEYIKLFGLREPKPEAYALQSMKLDCLKIYFNAPSYEKFDFFLVGTTFQRVIVDSILAAAWPFIRGHTVQLIGYVKRSSRALFKAWQLEEREAIEAWQKQRAAAGDGKGEISEYYAWLDEEEEGGVSLHEKAAAEDLAGHDEESLFPPVCSCSKPCGGKRWTCKD